MLSKVFSLLSLLFGALTLVLFSMERRRVESAGALLPLKERIEHSVRPRWNVYRKETAKLTRDLAALSAKTGQSSGEGAARVDGAWNSRIDKAAKGAWTRHQKALSEAVAILQSIPIDPGAAALGWRWRRERKFDEKVTGPRLEEKLKLSRDRLARVRRELLDEYFDLYRYSRQVLPGEAGRRKETDKRIKQQVYAGDDAGYRQYLGMRRGMAALRAGRKVKKPKP